MDHESNMRELLLWAKNKYELSMSFVTGDTLRDQDRQRILLMFINKIESLLKDADHRDASAAETEKPQEQRG